MINQQIPIVLIILMLISPIVSAFDHCSDMGMLGYKFENQSLPNSMSMIDISPLMHKKMFMGQQNNQAEKSCDAGVNCTFHACGGYGLISSAPLVNTVISLYYLDFEYTLAYSTTLSLDLRPPILTL